jgi:hypothetical protein
MKTELKFALIFIAMQLAWLIIEVLSGLQTTHKDLHPIVSNFILIPSVAIMAIGIRAKKKDLGGHILFKEAFLAGVVMSFIIAMLSPLVILIFDKLINPNFFTDFQNYAVEKGMLNMEQAKEYFNLKNYMIQSALGAMVMGTVTSAIVAAIIRTKKRDEDIKR